MVEKRWYQKLPNTYIILFTMILFGAVLTWIIPAGEFTRIASPTGRMIIENGTYHGVEKNPASLFDVFVAIPKGLEASAQIIFMILLSSGTFGLMNYTGALENSIGVLIKKTQKLNISGSKVVFFITCLFSCLGIIIGPEIQIPFTLIAVSIALGLGFDLLTGAGMVIVGGGIGFAMSPINASTIGTSDAICGLPLFSGMLFRSLVWFTTTIAAALVLTRYARMVKENPESSYTKGIRVDGLGLEKDIEEYQLSRKDKRVLGVFFALFLCLIIGPTKLHWYLNEMMAVFLISAIAVAVVAKIKAEEATRIFMKSAGAMYGAAMMVGLGRSIQVVMQNGKVLDTIVKVISEPLANFGPYMAAPMMTSVHGLVNFLIPSGSGQAAATMPIMFPVGQLVGLTDQTSILAFQIGDGITNLIFPTAGAMMAILGMARVPFEKWVKFAIRVVVVVYAVTWIFLLIAVKINWGPF